MIFNFDVFRSFSVHFNAYRRHYLINGVNVLMPAGKKQNNRQFGRDRSNAITEMQPSDGESLSNGRPRRGAHVQQMGQGIDPKHSQMKGAASMEDVLSQQHSDRHNRDSSVSGFTADSNPTRNRAGAVLNPKESARSTLTITLGKSSEANSPESKSSSFFQSFAAKQAQKHTVGRAFNLLDKTQSLFNLGGEAGKKGFAQLQNMRMSDEANSSDKNAGGVRDQLRPFFDPENNQQKLRIEIGKKPIEVQSADDRRQYHSDSHSTTHSQSDEPHFFQAKPMTEEAFLKTDKGKAVQGFAQDLIKYAQERQASATPGSSLPHSASSAQDQRIKSSVKTHKDGSKTQTVEIQKAGKPDMNSLLQLGMLATKGAASVSGMDAKHTAKLNNQMQKLGGLLGTAQKLGVFKNQPKPVKMSIEVQQKAQSQQSQNNDTQTRSRANAVTAKPSQTKS